MAASLPLAVLLANLGGGRAVRVKSFESGIEDARVNAESGPLSPEFIHFGGKFTCDFVVRRQRVASRVLAVSLFKAKVGYLDVFQQAALSWHEYMKSWGPDWNLRIYVDASVFRRLLNVSEYNPPVIAFRGNVSDFLSSKFGMKEEEKKHVSSDCLQGWDTFFQCHWLTQSGIRGEILTAIAQWIEDQSATFTVRDDHNWLGETLLNLPKRYNNIELWNGNCPFAHKDREAGTDGISLASTSVREKTFKAHVGTFVSALRFHPWFDESIEVGIARNFELMTSIADAHRVNDWLKSGSERFIAYSRESVYDGDYKSCGNDEDKEDIWHIAGAGPTPKTHYIYTEELANAMLPLENAKQKIFRDNDRPLTRRLMLLAGLHGARRLAEEESSALPMWMWDLLFDLPLHCGYKGGAYGFDEFGLSYLLKYLPMAWRLYKQEDDSHTVKEFLVKALGDPMSGVRVPSNAEYDPYALTPENTRVLPFAWGLQQVVPFLIFFNLERGKTIVRDLPSGTGVDYPSTHSEMVHLVSSSLGSGSFADLVQTIKDKFNDFLPRCDIPCGSHLEIASDVQPLLQGLCPSGTPQARIGTTQIEPLRSFEQVWHILNDFRMCGPMHLYVREWLLAHTAPGLGEMADEQMETILLQDYRRAIRAVMNKAVTSEFLEFRFFIPLLTMEIDIASVNAKLWLRALLEEFIVVSIDLPGNAAKSKTGVVFRRAWKELFLSQYGGGDPVL